MPVKTNKLTAGSPPASRLISTQRGRHSYCSSPFAVVSAATCGCYPILLSFFFLSFFFLSFFFLSFFERPLPLFELAAGILRPKRKSTSRGVQAPSRPHEARPEVSWLSPRSAIIRHHHRQIGEIANKENAIPAFCKG
ncbi:MAG TPA: hypothetical protein VFZ16_12235 [Hyphomicrobiaceae bacterium]|nr:hypothetical protein [Hyphomicrobiaceae bacterium]